jgi:hypothetical protein
MRFLEMDYPRACVGGALHGRNVLRPYRATFAGRSKP